MAASVNSTYTLQLNVNETLGTGVDGAAQPTINHSSYGKSATMNATSTPAVSKQCTFSKALSGGAATIDLTALTGTNGAAVDLTGLKIQQCLFYNPSTNTGTITITFGAANPYLLFGSAFKIILPKGGRFAYACEEDSASMPDVAAGAKNIDLAGTGTEALKVQLVAG